IKPLYYTMEESGVHLASEVKVLSDPSATITPRSIAAYLQWGACPEDQLLFAGIHVLPAGHAMTISQANGCEAWRYWPSRKAFASSPVSAPQKVRALLETAVSEHLLSDV